MGVEETEIQIASTIDTLHIYLVPTVLDASPLADYDADPAGVNLCDTAGLKDPLLKEVGAVLLQLISRPPDMDGIEATVQTTSMSNTKLAPPSCPRA